MELKDLFDLSWESLRSVTKIPQVHLELIFAIGSYVSTVDWNNWQALTGNDEKAAFSTRNIIEYMNGVTCLKHFNIRKDKLGRKFHRFMSGAAKKQAGKDARNVVSAIFYKFAELKEIPSDFHGVPEILTDGLAFIYAREQWDPTLNVPAQLQAHFQTGLPNEDTSRFYLKSINPEWELLIVVSPSNVKVKKNGQVELSESRFSKRENAAVAVAPVENENLLGSASISISTPVRLRNPHYEPTQAKVKVEQECKCVAMKANQPEESSGGKSDSCDVGTDAIIMNELKYKLENVCLGYTKSLDPDQVPIIKKTALNFEMGQALPNSEDFTKVKPVQSSLSEARILPKEEIDVGHFH